MSFKTDVLYQFDQFEVDPARRQLTRDGAPVPVPHKVLHLLLFFMQHPVEVLPKKDLMEAVWPNAFVEEANLTQTIFLLRKALGEGPGQTRYVVTVPGEGYQFTVRPRVVELFPEKTHPAAKVGVDSTVGAEEGAAEAPSTPAVMPTQIQLAVTPRPAHPRKTRVVLGGSVLLVLVSVGFGIGLWHRGLQRKVTGNLILADFENTTGDKTFDSALRLGLAAQLQQSPELGVVSDARIAQALQKMGQPASARLTPEFALQVCARTGSAATVQGSIAILGQEYVLGVKVTDCQSGETLALDQEVATSKERVIERLGFAADRLRRKLGESAPSLRRHNAALADVTTGSLQALEAYSLGVKAQNEGDCAAAITLFKQALTYDPSFAMAYSHIGVCDTGDLGVVSTRKAYELRSRVSDREKYYLASHYEQYATGNLTSARKILEDWSITYPHDTDAAPNLLKLYLTTGEYERALPLVQALVQNSPGTPAANASRLATTLIYLNRINDAKQILLNAAAHRDDVPVHHYYLYEIYFLENDSASMAREASFVRAQHGWTSNMLNLESVTARYFGKFAFARTLTEQAVQDDIRDENLEEAAASMADAALQEALAGNKRVAVQQATASLALSRSSGVEELAGMALALAGDQKDSTRVLQDINDRFPTDTLAAVAAATMRAALLLDTENSPAEARRAVVLLEPTQLYAMSGNLSMVPVYVRGQAYLASGDGVRAAADFRRILDNPGITRNYITGSLARLALAKAEEQADRRGQAGDDYALFQQLWKDADQMPKVRKRASLVAKMKGR